MTKNELGEATRVYQTYLEIRRQHADRFDDDQLQMLDEDVIKARSAMTVAWLEGVLCR